MPDWSYQTLFRPLLFQLPAARARALTLGALGLLANTRLGPQLIALLGHTAPAPSLSRIAWGITFPSPVGLGADLPDNERASGALARFGVGFVEVGPVTELRQVTSSPAPAVERRTAEQAIRLLVTSAVIDADALLATLEHHRLPIPLGVRLGHAPHADAEAAARERAALITRFGNHATFFTLTPPPLAGTGAWTDAEWQAHLRLVQARAQALGKPLLVGIAPVSDTKTLERIFAPAVAAGVAGVAVCGGIATADGARLLGLPARDAAYATVRSIHTRWGEQLTIMAAGGIHTPRDALALLAAGAAFVQLDSGLVYAGPGLPKRTNEVIRFVSESLPARTSHPRLWLRESWFWLFLLGLGMMISGTLAWLIALSRVVLPYDEAFVGMTRAQLVALNPRLLAFMAHDRVTLAGTMISIGVLYAQLAIHGVRTRAHWARRAIAVSATVGFLSFFLFLGFGYFDPLHALAALLLLPLFLLGLRAQADAPPAIPALDLDNDRAWQLAQWGQLCMVALGIGLAVAGLTIALVGITQIFVPEDLGFLRTTTATLRNANARILPLIAHDRAGFGGALVSDGLAVLLIALWGIRRGARWIWWTLLCAGLPGFVAAIGVHAATGYLDLWHLAPAFLAVTIFAAGLALLYPYLARPRRETR
jgi:dihydroorotate dehydrogenase